MLKKEQELLQEIGDKLSAYKEVKRAIVFGSRVRGDHRGDSDYDILIIIETKNPQIKEKIIDIFYSYELKKEISFSLTILSKNEYKYNINLGSPYLKNIKKEGIIFYDSQQKGKKSTLKVSS